MSSQQHPAPCVTDTNVRLATIYTEHAPAIRRYLAVRLSDPTLADDLCSEVFVEVAARLPIYQERGYPISAWLYRLARSRLVDNYRRTRTQPTAPLDPQLVSADTVEDRVLAQLDRAAVRQALAALTATQRTVLALRFTHNLSAPEVAAQLNTTPGAVKAAQHRAIAALQCACGVVS